MGIFSKDNIGQTFDTFGSIAGSLATIFGKKDVQSQPVSVTAPTSKAYSPVITGGNGITKYLPFIAIGGVGLMFMFMMMKR